MHARIAIAADALDTRDLPDEVANFIHRNATECVAMYGRLVLGSAEEARDLITAIRREAALPQDAQNRWNELLIHLHKTGRLVIRQPDAPALASLNALDDLRLHWGDDTDVAVVAAESGNSLLAVPPGDRNRPEVATAVSFDNSDAIRRIRRLAESSTAPTGTSREEFWSDVLGPLAATARQVTIFDRYLFKALWDLDSGKPWTRRWQGEHLGWLLQRLHGAQGPTAEVRLVGAWDTRDYSDATVHSTAELLRAAWPPAAAGRLGKVTVTLATPNRIADFPHDRHIRFGTGSALTLNAGFDRLRDARIWDADGLGWQYRWAPNAIEELEVREERALGLPHTDLEI